MGAAEIYDVFKEKKSKRVSIISKNVKKYNVFMGNLLHIDVQGMHI
jgi:hypothetical protein